jgi:L-threonylcarbamoyladenylate synthase
VTTTGVPGEPDPQGAAETELPVRHRRFDCTAGDPSLNSEATEAAREAIEAGECIVLPTDTVYGIGVDAFSAKAVQRLLDAKHRGRDMPPPVLIGEPTLIRALAVDVPETAKDLVGKHWPGALTVICHIQPSLRMDLGDSEGTIALRVPDHELAREILRRTGPMAVSSANISGRSAALSCDEAVEQLGDSVAVYLDGGPLSDAGGAPSTIVDFTHEEDGQVLRRGAISLETLRETVPNLLDLADDGDVEEDGSPVDPGHISAAGG